MSEYRFQVNLLGMIELLSDHLYSSPDVFIRELLQNATDAISARKKFDSEFSQGRINIKVTKEQAIQFEDNGTGLTEEEIHRFLAVIGESSKKDLVNGTITSDYIGRFGIGLLSCFMVSDKITVLTRSKKEEITYQWIGYPDGTYEIQKMDEQIPIGTSIFLEAKKGMESFFTKEKVQELVLYYGLLLPFPIVLSEEDQTRQINPIFLPWDGMKSTKDEIMFFGQMLFKTSFFDSIKLYSKEGQVEGVAYILPYKVQPSTKQHHRIYLKNMLLTERGEHILPDWAVFTKCIINAKELRPMASREGFYEDDILEKARENLGSCILNHLIFLAKNDKKLFAHFLSIHATSVKSMAIESDELFHLLFDYLEFFSTKGMVSGLSLRMTKEVILYTDNLEEYKQLSQVFFAQGKLLINAAYVYDLEMLEKAAEHFGLELQPVNSEEVSDLLKNLSVTDSEETEHFLLCARKIMKKYDCNIEIKRFMPANLPTFYYNDEAAEYYRDIQSAKEKSDSMFGSMLEEFSYGFSETMLPILYLNYSNPVIKKIMTLKLDELEDYLVILYTQALLIGGFSLKNNELGIMNEKILKIMESRMGDES